MVVSFWVEVSRVSQLPGGLGDTPVLSLVGLQPAGAAAGQRETKYETVCFDASSEWCIEAENEVPNDRVCPSLTDAT